MDNNPNDKEFAKQFRDDQLISLRSDIKQLEYLKAELSRPRVGITTTTGVSAESKKDLKKRGIPSPNLADALITAFAPRHQPFAIPDEILQ